MHSLIAAFCFLFLLTSHAHAEKESFSSELLAGKTFFITEATGYDTIAKFYLDEGELKLFYVIFYQGKLEETDTLKAKIDAKGLVNYTVFDRPTGLELVATEENGYRVREYHSGVHKNTLFLSFSKPDSFAAAKK